ncbi:MAG TPA: oligosaccharide flippase family protein [Ohtaekwangia sp.]|nr:oligosaccharide flippase family protein [Ohtaekwangia sp.]
MVGISKGFLKTSLIYTLAGTLPMASAVLLLPFYTDYLTSSEFGALSIYLAFSLLIQYITTYSFDVSLYIHYHEFKKDPPKLASFVGSAFVLMILIGLTVGVLLTLTGDLVFSSVFSDKSISFYPYGLLAAATGIFQALFKVHNNLIQSREKPVTFLWSNVGSFTLIVLFTIAGMIVYPNTLTGPVGGRFLAALIAGSWALIRIFREYGFHFNYPLLKTSFSFNFYTFIYQLMQWVINYFDRIIMVFYLALAQVGVYDFALKCLLIIEFILNGLHNSFYPKIVSFVMNQQSKGSSPEINRYYHGFISVIMMLICVCVFTFPWLIENLVSNPDYQKAIPYLPYIALLYIFRALRLFYAAPYGILKFTKPLPVVYGIVSIAKIGLIILFVQKLGIYGVIAASLISAGLEIILLRFNLGNKFEFRYNFLKVIAAPLTVFIMIIVLEPLFGLKYPTLIHGFYVVTCGVILSWAYRNEIKLINPLKSLR